MPPAAVRSLRDLIFWQYSKLISESAGYGKGNYGFIMDRFKKLRSGEIEWSGSIREYIREREVPGVCIYCGRTGELTTDHLIPRARGGQDISDNAVTCCKPCNSSKGDRGVYEWYGLEGRNEVPRIAEGKYLKLLFILHESRGTIDANRDRLKELCRDCTVGYLCKKTALTVYCLEAILTKKT